MQTIFEYIQSCGFASRKTTRQMKLVNGFFKGINSL